jgi:hypothetical protein
MFEVGTVSHGTLRLQDLIPACLSVLKEISQEEYDLFILDYPEYSENEDSEFYESEDALFMYDEVMETINQFCPERIYFGALEGDGSDIGFWQVQED